MSGLPIIYIHMDCLVQGIYRHGKGIGFSVESDSQRPVPCFLLLVFNQALKPPHINPAPIKTLYILRLRLTSLAETNCKLFRAYLCNPVTVNAQRPYSASQEPLLGHIQCRQEEHINSITVNMHILLHSLVTVSIYHCETYMPLAQVSVKTLSMHKEYWGRTLLQQQTIYRNESRIG